MSYRLPPRGVTEVLVKVRCRERRDVEEVGAAEVLVAIRLGGIDAGGLNDDLDARALGARTVEEQGSCEIAEAAAHFAQQVAYLKGDVRVAAINLEGAGGDGSLRGHHGLLLGWGVTVECVITLYV